MAPQLDLVATWESVSNIEVKIQEPCRSPVGRLRRNQRRSQEAERWSSIGAYQVLEPQVVKAVARALWPCVLPLPRPEGPMGAISTPAQQQ